MSAVSLEIESERAYIRLVRRFDGEIPTTPDGLLPKSVLWWAVYQGFESGFLRRHERTIDPGTLGIIREEKLNYIIGFDFGEQERKRYDFLNSL